VNSPGSNIPGVPFLHCTHPRRVLSQHRGNSRDGRYETLPACPDYCFTPDEDQGFRGDRMARKEPLCVSFPTTQGHSFAHPQISLKAPVGWLRCRLDVFASMQFFLENQGFDRRSSGRISLSTQESCASIVSRASEKCGSYPQPPHLSVDSYCAAPKRGNHRPCWARRRSRRAFSLMKPAASFWS
jgi:hypothetical protein